METIVNRSRRKHSNKNFKEKGNLIVTSLIFLLSIFIIYFMNMTPVNIEFKLNYQGANDGTQNTLYFTKKDSRKQEKLKTYIANNSSAFAINSELFGFEKAILEFSDIKKQDSITFENMEIYSKQSDTKKIRIGVLTAKDLFGKNSQSNVIQINSNSANGMSFSTDSIIKINKIINKNNPLKIYFIVIITYIYVLFLLKLFLFKKVDLVKYSILSLTIIIFSGLMFNVWNSDNLSVNSNEVTTDFNKLVFSPLSGTPIQQEFSAKAKNLNGIEMYFQNQDDQEEAVLVSLYEKKTNNKIYSKIVTTKDISRNPLIEMRFKELKDSEEMEYKLELKHLFGNLGSLSVGLVPDNKSNLKIDGEERPERLNFSPKFNSYNYQLAVIVLSVLMFLVLGLIYIASKWGFSPNIVILLIYVIVLLFSIYKINFYHQYVKRTPDEIAHISYVAYLSDNPDQLIPSYEEMKIGSKGENNVITFPDGSPTNYLGHPPLYYKFLSLFGGVVKTPEGNLIMRENRIFYLSASIVFLSVLLMFYISFTRLEKKPIIHLLFATMVTSVPMFIYMASGINNDSLTILTVTIFFFGVLRFSEGNRTFLTYFLIGLGICLTLFTKLTAGIMVVMIALIFIVWYMLKDRSFRAIACKEFLVTIPIYLITVFFFVKIYQKYSSFQPALKLIDPESYFKSGFYVPVEQRIQMSLTEFINKFFTSFFSSWTGISSHISIEKEAAWYSPSRVFIILIMTTPIMLLFKKIKNHQILLYKASVISLIITFIMQYFNAEKGFYINGYPGGFQSRYFLCAIVIFSFITIKVIEKLKNIEISELSYHNKTIFKNITGETLILCVTSIWFVFLMYSDFIYLLLNFKDYLI